MLEIVNNFMAKTKIEETPNGTVRQIMEFLTEPESVAAMIMMTKLGQPALSGVVKKLEEKFANSDFPLHHDAEDKNAPNRRNIGWMVKYIMAEFGYEPIPMNELKKDETYYLKSFCKSDHFSSSALYRPIENAVPNYTVITKIAKIV